MCVSVYVYIMSRSASTVDLYLMCTPTAVQCMCGFDSICLSMCCTWACQVFIVKEIDLWISWLINFIGFVEWNDWGRFIHMAEHTYSISGKFGGELTAKLKSTNISYLHIYIWWSLTEPPNLNPPIFLQWRYRVQSPNLIPTNISGYTVYMYLVVLKRIVALLAMVCAVAFSISGDTPSGPFALLVSRKW